MTYGPAYQFSLQSIILTDKLHTTSSGQYLDLVYSPFPSEGDIVTVLYRKVSLYKNCKVLKERERKSHGVKSGELGGQKCRARSSFPCDPFSAEERIRSKNHVQRDANRAELHAGKI